MKAMAKRFGAMPAMVAHSSELWTVLTPFVPTRRTQQVSKGRVYTAIQFDDTGHTIWHTETELKSCTPMCYDAT